MIRFYLLCSVLLTILISGCGGGGGSSSNPSVTGVAATGSAVVGTVYLKDSSNPSKELSQAIAADGSYSFDVTGLTAPFLLKAVGTADGQPVTIYAFCSSPGIANLNPISNAAAMAAAGTDIGLLYASGTPAALQAANSAFAEFLQDLINELAPLFAAYNTSGVNPATTRYVVNHQGLDALFDNHSFQVVSGTVTIKNRNGATVFSAQLNDFANGVLVLANILPPGSGPVTTDIPETNQTLQILRNGVYEVYFDFEYEGGGIDEKVGLDSTGTYINIWEEDDDEGTDYLLVNKSWKPVPVFTNDMYKLESGNAQSLTFRNTYDGTALEVTYKAIDISGKNFNDAFADTVIEVDGAVPSGIVFPAGSARYDAWTRLSADRYFLDDVTDLTTLSQALAPGDREYLATGHNDEFHVAAVVQADRSVKLYRVYEGSGSEEFIGTGQVVDISGLIGQPALEIAVPAELRASYEIVMTPIYGMVNGRVYLGAHLLPGVTSYTGHELNETAANYIDRFFPVTTALQKSAAKTTSRKPAQPFSGRI